MLITETNQAYHANNTHISKSGMMLFEKSPQHYAAAYLRGGRVNEQTEALIMGTFTHSVILEPHTLARDYFYLNDAAIVAKLTRDGSKSPRATNEYRDWRNDQFKANHGKEVITAEQFDTVRSMRQQVVKSAVYKQFIEHPASVFEKSIYWQCTKTGAKVKIRFDHYNPEVNAMTDLKTCESADIKSATRACRTHYYDRQAALYPYVLSGALDVEWPSFVFLFVEKQRPYLAAPYYISAARLQQAHSDNLRTLERVFECHQTGRWPGYDTGEIMEIDF